MTSARAVAAEGNRGGSAKRSGCRLRKATGYHTPPTILRYLGGVNDVRAAEK